jgi:hypothetical protein
MPRFRTPRYPSSVLTVVRIPLASKIPSPSLNVSRPVRSS